MEEQLEIVKKVKVLMRKIDEVDANQKSAFSKLEWLNKGILAKAFKGELVTQDPTDEPAAALLTRIQSQAATAPAAKQKRKRSA